MYRLVRQSTFFSVFALASLLALSGCATKKYVRQQVGALEPKITEVSNATKENGERIDAVDRRAQQGIQSATTAAQNAQTSANNADQRAGQAQTAAQAADTKAGQAQTAANTAQQGVQQANTRIATVETRINNLDNFTVGQPETVMFKLNAWNLTPEAKNTLDMIASQVSGQRSGYLVEIQGFTDSKGSENYNVGLSQRRAESVLRYLVSKNVPLHRISIVGLGEDSPVADNKTKAGREMNRRAEVRILRAAGATSTNDDND
jgi:outer membrane protein OmpA-like peptidoglycan-associated protein